MGWTASKGTIYVLAALAYTALLGLLFVVLVIVATVAKKSGPAIAALALAATFLVGFLVAPDAPGSWQNAPGTGTAGTLADPAALWSGPVSCGWPKDEATSIERVDGFNVPIVGALVPPAMKDMRDVRATSVQLDPHFSAPSGDVAPNGGVYYTAKQDSEGWTGSVNGSMRPTVFENTTYWHSGANLEGVSADGRTGTAVLPEQSDIVLQWSCSGGP